MEDYGENTSYGSYLSRVFAIIIAFLLLIAAIWLVVKLASNDSSETLGDRSSISVDHGGIVANNDNSSNSEPVDADGHTLSTNTDIDSGNTRNVAGVTTDGLPNTGAEVYSIAFIGLLTFAGSKIILDKSQA